MSTTAAHLPPDLPADQEAERIRCLRRYEILDTPPDGSFDRITHLAARLFSVPISLVTLVDTDRIWFKSRHGLDGVNEIGRDPGLCASAVLHGAPWVLPDASVDPRLLANPLVAGEFGLRFYAGAPLRTHDGHHLGTLCVIDKEPREVAPEEIAHLEDLASAVMDQMELRIAARRAVSQKEILLRELHHRVKNNLQILFSLVAMCERRSEHREIRDFLQSLRGRLVAMSSAHDALQGNDTLETAWTGELLQKVCDAAHRALCPQATIDTEIENHELAVEAILPLALVLNELLTNACKYALRDGRGKVLVSFKSATDAEFALVVRDFGPGLRRETSNGSGLSFVDGLVRQIRGSLRIDDDDGAICTVSFPASAH